MRAGQDESNGGHTRAGGRVREDDGTYFARRAIQEQVASQNASCEAARERHDELAMMYRFRSAMLTRAPIFWADALRPEQATVAA